MKKILNEYFSFTQREMKGIILLVILCMASLFCSSQLKYWIRNEQPFTLMEIEAIENYKTLHPFDFLKGIFKCRV